jgi:hypothetical protein
MIVSLVFLGCRSGFDLRHPQAKVAQQEQAKKESWCFHLNTRCSPSAVYSATFLKLTTGAIKLTDSCVSQMQIYRRN